MSGTQDDLESATWAVGLVDAEVKLYLLALIRTGDATRAMEISGLSASSAASAHAWLQEVGVLNRDGAVDADVLHEAKNDRLAAA